MSALTTLHLLTVCVELLALALVASQCRLLVVMQRAKKVSPSIEARAHALTGVLTHYSLFVEISTVILLLMNIPVVAFSSMSWQQLFMTTFSKVSMLELLLLTGIFILALLISGMFHPLLKKELQKYSYVQKRYQHIYERAEAAQSVSAVEQQLTLREERLAGKLRRVMYTEQWIFLAAVSVLMCASLTTVFAALPTAPTKGVQSNATHTATSPFVKTVMTTDRQYRVTLTVTPNRFGTNEFTVRVVKDTTGALATNVHVTLALNMLDMNMGTDILPLQTDGQGQLSGKGTLSMAGNWQIVISVHTPDEALHRATVVLWTI